MLVIVVDVPYNIGVRYKIDFTVVKCSDSGEYYRRTISLDGLTVEVILKIVVEISYLDPLVSVIACEVNCCK